MLALRSVVEKLAEAAARRAANLRYKVELGFSSETEKLLEEVVEEVASMLVFEKKGLLRCAICTKGPFTRKGLYLHLIRVHRDYIEELVRRTLEKRLLRGSGGAEHAHGA